MRLKASVTFFSDINSAELEILPSQNINEGDSLTLFCKVDGTLPVSYAWFKNAKIITGAERNILILENTQRTGAGQYRCSATNNAGNKLTKEENVVVNCKFLI